MECHTGRWQRLAAALLGVAASVALASDPPLLKSATGSSPQTESPTAQSTQQGGPEPTLEFLEFLGQFETEDGAWLDPLDVNDVLEAGATSEDSRQ